MAPKGAKPKAQTKKELDDKRIANEIAAESAKAKRTNQAAFGTAMASLTNPTEQQQQTLDLYKSLPFRSELKGQIIAKWKQDTVSKFVSSFGV
jgi:hypothetical protein